MSEYQYHEFQVLEQPLSAAQRAELRACSTRAEITTTSLINEYHWGDLKADPLDWMERHFDAYVYSANWGCCQFMLAMPLEALGRAVVQEFGGGQAFSITQREGRWILAWSLELDDGDYERFRYEDGPDWMARLLALRQELMNGDLRPLYLGWVARLCACELDDEALEPAPPPGLAKLTPAQQALAEFLMLDQDLLSVAVGVSGASAAERSLRRTALQIEQDREAAMQLRLDKEKRLRAQRERKVQRKRGKRLAEVASQADVIWTEIEGLLQRATGASYTQAEAAVIELAEALTAAGRRSEFDATLARQLATNGKRQAWRNRLRNAGLI